MSDEREYTIPGFDDYKRLGEQQQERDSKDENNRI